MIVKFSLRYGVAYIWFAICWNQDIIMFEYEGSGRKKVHKNFSEITLEWDFLQW